MNELFLVVAPSGSGKDYLVSKMCSKFGLKKVTSRTTRKPRFSGEKSYKFKTISEWNKEKSEAIAPAYYCGNHYWTMKGDLENANFYIVEPSGIDAVKESGLEFKVIYINTPILRRIKYMRRRGDKFISILKRIANDIRGFKGVKSKADFIVKDEVEFESIFLK
ncbi:hypothetical protein [uncultured Clostridium sp.]|uniref:hypothetical protein n=1 Tax=uncultured Clostridium sp. TaxID=59620 RepID=UPI002604EED9|nr:hypothetical protein [uncultured Clostridium sp.]